MDPMSQFKFACFDNQMKPRYRSRWVQYHFWHQTGKKSATPKVQLLLPAPQNPDQPDLDNPSLPPYSWPGWDSLFHWCEGSAVEHSGVGIIVLSNFFWARKVMEKMIRPTRLLGMVLSSKVACHSNISSIWTGGQRSCSRCSSNKGKRIHINTEVRFRRFQSQVRWWNNEHRTHIHPPDLPEISTGISYLAKWGVGRSPHKLWRSTVVFLSSLMDWSCLQSFWAVSCGN